MYDHYLYLIAFERETVNLLFTVILFRVICGNLGLISKHLIYLQELPKLNRIPGVKLCGKAFADILMVFEFLHNFGETLGFGKFNSY